MNRTAAYLIGPEFVWLLIVGVAGLVVMTHQPPVGIGRGNLILLKLFLPSIGVILAFVPLFWAPGMQGWWVARIVVASLIGVVLLVGFLSRLAGYGDIRDVGLIVGFVGFVALGWTVLGMVGGLATLFLMSGWPFLPILKYIVILTTVFLIFLRIQWAR